MKKESRYPEHPDQLVVKKNEFFPSGISELDVWNYYEGIKSKLIPELKGRDLFIVIATKPGSKLFIRHPYDKKTEFIRINNEKQFEEYHSGKTREDPSTSSELTTEAVFDFDPGPSATFDEIKDVVEQCIDFIKKQKDFSKSIDLRFTGGRSFHVQTSLKSKRRIEDIKKDIEDRLEKYFEGNDKIVIASNKPSGHKVNIDLSPMKVNGGHVSPYSMRISTGLCCISVSSLKSFKKEEAKFDRVYEKLTGKKFKWGNKKKGCLLVLQEINKFGKLV